MTDTIADMLSRVRNAQMVGKKDVYIPFSKMKLQLANILADEGYVGSVTEDTDEGGRPAIKVTLKYVDAKPAIQELKRISKPGKRVYVGADKLPYVYDDLGIAVLSTSQGLMTNKQARSARVGGEVICQIF